MGSANDTSECIALLLCPVHCPVLCTVLYTLYCTMCKGQCSTVSQSREHYNYTTITQSL